MSYSRLSELKELLNLTGLAFKKLKRFDKFKLSNLNLLNLLNIIRLPRFRGACGQRRIRTSVLVREQIYSLSPLATRPSAHESHLPESNWRPTDYKSVALPAELRWLIFQKFRPCWIQDGNTLKSYPLFWEGKGKGIWIL